MHRVTNPNSYLDLLLKNNFSKIYFYQALLTMGKTLIGVFIPVFLYKSGFSIIEILLYSVGISAVHIIMSPQTIKLIKLIGFKWLLLLSTPIFILHITLLNFVQDSYLIFNLCWLTYGLYASLFWPAYHSEIALRGSNKHRSSEIGTIQIIITLVSTLTPVIGGFILEKGEYYQLLIASAVIIILGMIPLLISKDIKLSNYTFSYRDYIRLIKDKSLVGDRRAFIAHGVEEGILNLFIWPIFLFIILSENYLSLGILMTVVSLFASAMIFFIKSYITENNRTYLLKKLSQGKALGWVVRFFVTSFSVIFLYVIESFYTIIKSISTLSFDSIFYNNAKKTNYMDYIMLSDLTYQGGKAFFILVLVIPALMYFGESLNVLGAIIVFGIISSLGLTYMVEK